MARFYGEIGYAVTEETTPGVWEETISRRNYYGEVLQNARRWETGEGANDNLTLNNRISILADAYAYEHFFAMRFIAWGGALWKITNVEVQRPRLLLTIGGIYNGPET